MQVWAGDASLAESERYNGELTAMRAVSPDGDASSITVLTADPMIAMSQGLIEEFFGVEGMHLLDALRINTPDGPVIYIVRGVDTARGVYYLSWPD